VCCGAQFSRGDLRLLTRLLWFGREERRIQRTQKQLGKAIGGLKRDSSGKLVHRDVSDSMVRRHLRNLGSWVEVEQGGPGQPASYYFTDALPQEFCSGLSPELFRAKFRAEFRAENSGACPRTPQNTPVAAKKFRAEIPLSSSVEKLKSKNGLDADDEKSARVTVSPRATSVPFPQASKLSTSESEGQRQPHSDPEQEMKLRLQERHPTEWENCVTVIRKALRKFPLSWADLLALDNRHTGNPSGLRNPRGYYYNLAAESVKEAANAVRESARVSTAVKETAPCEKCVGRSGVMADRSFCDCTLGRDLAKQAKWKQARADAKPADGRMPITPNTRQRIEKLQALADRGTEHEAALAAHRISEIHRRRDVA
jgi:hypothetical protein